MGVSQFPERWEYDASSDCFKVACGNALRSRAGRQQFHRTIQPGMDGHQGEVRAQFQSRLQRLGGTGRAVQLDSER